MPEYKQKHHPEEKIFSAIWLKNYLMVIIGSLILAFGFVFFIVPHDIVPGGVFGLGIIFNHLFGLPIGLTAFAINIPLLITAMRLLGFDFGFKTILAIIVSSASIDGLIYFCDCNALSDDILVSAVFGGVLIGIAIALMIKAGATPGGTAMAARIISKYTRLPVGQMLLIVDGLIVAASIFVFRSLDVAPYAIIAIFAISRSVDAVLDGLDSKKVVFIISDKYDDIRKIILEKMDRGGMYLDAKGLFYSDNQKQVIFTALSRKEVITLENHIRIIDKDAFLIAMDASEIIGRGYKPFHN